MAETLAELFPPLKTYCPILPLISVPQGVFLTLPTEYEEALYGGAVGGGKTAALLMEALKYVDVPGYAALILRRTYAELEQPDGPIPQSQRWFATVPQPERPVYNKSEHTWTFPSSAVLVFGHLDNPNAMIRYQGGGYHFLGFDELTHFDEEPYQFIGLSRSRRPPSGPLSQIPMRVRASANPGGPGHIWVKRRFITHRPDDVAFVPAKLADNPGVDTEDYARRLGKMNEVLRRQLMDGDWGAFEGAAYEADENVHVIPQLDPPAHWERFESLDPGYGTTAWLLWAVDTEGNLLVLDEYVADGRIVSENVAAIKALRADWWQAKDDDGWTVSTNRVWADPYIHKGGRGGGERVLGEPTSLLTEYNDAGMAISLANNDPRAGFAHLRELMKPQATRLFPGYHDRRGEPGAPQMFIVKDRCPHLWEQFKSAPLQPIDKPDAGEKVDPAWEGKHGHSLAACRYGAMSRPGPSKEPEQPLEDPRAEHMRQLRKRRADRALVKPALPTIAY